MHFIVFIHFITVGMLGGTVSKLFVYNPTKDYPRMFVKCMAFQIDSEGYNIYEPDIVTSSFEVVFPPLPSETPLQTFFIDEGNKYNLDVTTCTVIIWRSTRVLLLLLLLLIIIITITTNDADDINNSYSVNTQFYPPFIFRTNCYSINII